MANCPSVNEEKSGPANGWFCNICGQPVDSSFYTNYCNSDVNCQHCPHKGGDDHIRNPEALTVEICGRIRESTRRNISEAYRQVSAFLGQLCAMVDSTNYGLLSDRVSNAVTRRIGHPAFNGKYVDIVLTDIEKERAEGLETDLNHIFWEMEPADCVGTFSQPGRFPRISSEFFSRLTSMVENNTSNIGNTINGIVDAGGISKYEDLVYEAQRELEQEVHDYMNGIQDAVSIARNTFESGCSQVFGSMGRWGAGSPGGPRWGE